MIVLDQHAVVEPHAMVLRAAHPRRIFFEHAQAGNGLARVEQDRAGAGDRVDIVAGERGDSRQMLERVQRRPLGGEHGAGVAVEPHQRPRRLRPRRRPSTSSSISTVAVERRKKAAAISSPATTIGCAAVHLRREAGIGGDGRGGSDIAAAPEILGEHALDEIVEIEACGKRSWRRALMRRARMRRCSAGCLPAARPAIGSAARRPA